MSEDATALLEKAIGLDPAERERLAHTLMEYVENERESLRVAEERLEDVESGRGKMVPAREVMAKLRAGRL